MLRQMMRISEGASKTEIAQEAMTRTLDNKFFALFIAWFTAYFPAEKISYYGSVLACILTIVLICKHSFGFWRDYKKAKKEDAESKTEED